MYHTKNCINENNVTRISMATKYPIIKDRPIQTHTTFISGVIGSDVPWLECPACNALTWVITVKE